MTGIRPLIKHRLYSALDAPGDDSKSGFFDSIEATGRKTGEDPTTIYDNPTLITHGTTPTTIT